MFILYHVVHEDTREYIFLSWLVKYTHPDPKGNQPSLHHLQLTSQGSDQSPHRIGLTADGVLTPTTELFFFHCFSRLEINWINSDAESGSGAL
jgi:hypothetical protein